MCAVRPCSPQFAFAIRSVICLWGLSRTPVGAARIQFCASVLCGNGGHSTGSRASAHAGIVRRSSSRMRTVRGLTCGGATFRSSRRSLVSDVGKRCKRRPRLPRPHRQPYTSVTVLVLLSRKTFYHIDRHFARPWNHVGTGKDAFRPIKSRVDAPCKKNEKKIIFPLARYTANMV